MDAAHSGGASSLDLHLRGVYDAQAPPDHTLESASPSPPQGSICQGRISGLAVWILAAKLPNSDLNFAGDLGVDFSSCSFKEKPDPPILGFAISLLSSFSDFPCLFCAFFLSFPRILGVPRRDKKKKNLHFSGFPLFFFLQKTRVGGSGGPKKSTKKSPAKFTREFGRINSPRGSAEALLLTIWHRNRVKSGNHG